MNELPTLLVHGWWISKLLVVAAGGAGVGLLVLIRWAVQARQQRVDARLRVATGTPLVGDAAAGAAPSRPPGFGPWIVACFAVSGCIGYFGLRALGQRYVHGDGERDINRMLPDGVSNRDLLVIAAALPGTRDDALDELEIMWEFGVARTEAAARRRVALRGLRDGCVGEVAQLIREGLHDEALRREPACPSDPLAVQALIALGRYQGAALRITPASSSDERVLVLIATERWRDAATVIDELLARASMRREPAVADGARCLAELLRAFGGDAGAAGRLRRLGDPRGSSTCALAKAISEPEIGSVPAPRLGGQVSSDAAPGPQVTSGRSGSDAAPGSRDRAGMLARIAAARLGDPAGRIAGQLAWGYGAAANDLRDALAALTSHGSVDLQPWLVSSVRASSDSPSAWAWSAVRDIYRGDFAAAARAVDALAARSPASDETDDDPVQGLDLAIQLRAASAAIDPRRVRDRGPVYTLRGELALRGGRLAGVDPREWELTVSSEDCGVEARRAVEAAVTGDGTALARVVERCMIGHLDAAKLLALGPRITAGRDLVAAAVRTRRERPGAPPFALVRDLAMARDLSRAVGDADVVARLQAIIDRQLSAFHLREQVVAIALWRALE